MHAAKTHAATKEKDDIIVQTPKSHTNQSYHFVVIEPPTPRIVLLEKSSTQPIFGVENIDLCEWWWDREKILAGARKSRESADEV